MRGWHRVELDPVSKPRHIHKTSGWEMDEPSDETFETRVLIVPSQRCRRPRS
jgi:hypothetical protein